MDGVPCIAGTRLPVATVVGLAAEGLSPEDIVREYPQIERADVLAALEYAAQAVDVKYLPLRQPV